MANVFGQELWELRDKRVDNWLFMDSPWPTLTLCAAYIYFVKFMGPSFMKNRDPYQLKTTIQVYNILQVLLSAYIFICTVLGGWGTYYSWSK